MITRDKLREQFSKRLKNLLTERGISAYQVAKECSIDKGSVSKYLDGTRSPQIDSFLAICKYLQVSPNYFLDTPTVDYISDDAKSNEWKTIESLFFLSEVDILRHEKTDGGDCYSIQIPDGSILHEVLTEIERYKGSAFVKSESIGTKICETYEPLLQQENDQRSKH